VYIVYTCLIDVPDILREEIVEELGEEHPQTLLLVLEVEEVLVKIFAQ